MAAAMAMAAMEEEEVRVDGSLGYPRAYAKLCGVVFQRGPPEVFVPYTLNPNQALRAKELGSMFPVIDPEGTSSTNPRSYANILWKQLDHLGNAGFDPAQFRIDPYGNVLYLNADVASSLAWDIDHWFPCSRGGKTVLSNLRIVQWQVCRKKQNKLEFLVPWWDLQVGISVNQFLCIFASRNSDFRNRAFSFFFLDGGTEELNAVQMVDSHTFPQHFIEMKRKMGLAPAAVVPLQSNTSVLKSVDINKRHQPLSPMGTSPRTSIRRSSPSASKENYDPEFNCCNSNPYHAIEMARDSLRRAEESKRKQEEIGKLDEDLQKLKQSNETERVALQELEELLIRKRRRVEKCRQLAETQASYRSMLEKMIRDSMHKAVVYKEQIRLNQAAATASMARLEAQKELCDSSVRELKKRHKKQCEIEKRIRNYGGHARKGQSSNLFPIMEDIPIRKELRKFLEEEHKASEAGSFIIQEEESSDNIDEESNESSLVMVPTKDKAPNSSESSKLRNLHWLHERTEQEEDTQHRNKAGKEKIDKWVQIMLNNGQGTSHNDSCLQSGKHFDNSKGKRVSTIMTPPYARDWFSMKTPEEKVTNDKKKYKRNKSEGCKMGSNNPYRIFENRNSFEKQESSMASRSAPTSPLMTFSTFRKGVEHMGRVPKVTGDEDKKLKDDSGAQRSSKLIKLWARTSK